MNKKIKRAKRSIEAPSAEEKKAFWRIGQLLAAKKEKLAIAVFFVLVFLFYGNTLKNGFVLDDRAVIVENTYIQSLKYLPKVVTGCIWEHAINGCWGKTLHYRPLHTLSYLLTYQISSSPWIFHLVNLSYFFISVLLVFTVVRTITKKFSLAFLTAIFFLVHPINNEVVSWISAASELLFVVFGLLTVLYYLKYRQTKMMKNLWLAILFYFFAMLSKETAVVILPPLILALDFLVFKKTVKEIFRWQEIKKYLLFGIPFLVYFSMRQAVIGGLGGLLQKEAYFGSLPFASRIYYFFWLFGQYLKAIIYSYPLIFSHPVPDQPNFSHPWFIAGLCAFFLFLAALYLSVKKKKRPLSFFLAWFLLPILPVLIFYFVVSENFFAERYLFAPSIGFAFAVAYFFDHFLSSDSKKPRLAAIAAVVLLIIGSWLVVFPRNRLWLNSKTFLRADLALNPDAHSIREYLANVLKTEGDIEGAKTELEEIIRRNPRWLYISQVYNSLGDYYRQKGDLDEARENYEKAIGESEKIGNYKSYNNLGVLYAQKEEYLEALLYFCKAVQMAPDAEEPRHNFDRIASMTQSVSDENLAFLYIDVMSGGAFKKSDEIKIEFLRKQCVYDNCNYIFSPQIGQNEILLPFLIIAQAFPNELVRVGKTEYRSETGEISVTIDQKYSDKVITFMFPSCSGVYYEAATSLISIPNH